MSNDTVITSLKQKIDELNQQAWEARVNDSPKAFKISQESVELARGINYSKGLAEGLRSLGFGYIRLFKNDDAAPLLRESLTLFQSLNDLKGQAIVYEYLGIIERNWGNLGRSLELLLKGNGLIQQVDKIEEIEITSCYQIGVTYKHLGNHENALDYLYRALSLAKKTDFTLMESYAINIIGSIYFDNGDYKQALDCYQRGLVIRRESHDKWGEAGSLDNIGFTYLKLNELDKAIDYCKQSLGISKDNGDKKGEANALLHLAEIYGKAGDVKQASKSSNESLEIRTARGDKRGEAEVLLFLADLHKNNGEIEDQQIFGWISQALKIADGIKAQDLLSKAYYNLHEYYGQKGNYKESLAQLEAHLKIEKELHKNTINQKVTNLEISHKAEAISQRNKELTELNQQIEKANAELRIEACLERVRAVAMGMKKSGDLLNICETLFAELEVLGFKKLRNTIINIYNEEKGSFLSYDCFGQGETSISRSNYDSHPVTEKVTKQIRGATDAFVEFVLSGNDLEDWRKFREKNGEITDPKLKVASELYYYFYSVGNGALGISTLGPVTAGGLEILKRFRNVFDLSYRRYSDIEKAEAQAREAQVETALERIRARAMAMHSSDELIGVANILREQMGLLGQSELETCVVNLYDVETGLIYNWNAFRQPGLTSGPIKTSVSSFPGNASELTREMVSMYQSGKKEFTLSASGSKLVEFFELLVKSDPQVANYTGRYIPEKVFYHFTAFTGGTLLTVSYQPPNEDVKSLQRRAASVFDMAYRRYLDLKKAEANAREAQIETALERVRSRTMAMHKSNELLEVVASVFQQMKLLGFNLNLCNIVLFDSKTLGADYWVSASDQAVLPEGYHVPYADHPFYHYQLNTWKNAEPFAVFELSGEIKKSWDAILFTKTDLQRLPDSTKKMMQHLDSVIVSSVATKHGLVQAIGTEQLSNDDVAILSRFAKVFEQTYTRFLDLQKAEAQAKEAQVEAALERVRSRSMAMHKSDELREVVAVLFGQLQQLGFDIKFCTIALIDKMNSTAEFWLSGFSQDILPESYHVPNLDHPFYQNFQHTFRQGILYEVFELAGEEKRSYDKLWFTLTDFKNLPGPVKQPMMEMERVVMSCAFTKNGMIQIGGFEPLSDNDASIIQRFAKVFEQTYTRFLDLQKAEAQAREAQIEAALEKVRSRSLAMHKSDELKDVIHSVFQRLNDLNFELDTAIIIIFKPGSNDTVWWLENKRDQQHLGVAVNYTDISYFRHLFEAKKSGKEVISNFYDLEEKNKLLTYLFDHTDFRYTPEPQKEFLLHQECANMSVAIAKNTAIHITRYAAQSFSGTQHDILKKFSMVFDQAYTRFLDLQRAEVQAREAQIEAALERVRAKVMAMTNSKDLNETSLVFGEQLRKLGIDWQFSYFWLIEEEKNENTFWITWPDNKTSITVYTLEEAEKYFNECLISWRAGIRIHDNYVPPPDVQAWLDTFQRIADDAGGVAKQIMTQQTFRNGVFYYDAMMRYGSFGICINEPATDEEKNIQCRFAVEFERAYTRFLDLQKAEAQTRQALIEGALERVRARALAMQQPEELKDVAQVLRNEMGALGVEELETSSIYIHGESSENVECWYALRDPKHSEKKMVSDHFVLNLNDTWVGREMKKFHISGEKQTSIVMQGANRKEWIEYCYNRSPAFSGFYGETIPERTYHLYKFSHGYIGAAAPGDISNESWKLLSRAASVFSLAYSRFKDLTQARNDLIKLKEEKKRAEDALTELQNTQKQLIQTEKMASLGELTAGIAHEIQNPLNFVNNFSDVSNELLEEMKIELGKGNAKDAMTIANDVKDNLEKILHHGKRADAIVKGMLQHSRNSSGQKELTDINELVDEYLRLAYHGLRAKDKFFNAKFETDLDPSLDKINIVPQEIGRVILNLINNSFYAVSEKKKNAGNGYEPVVIVSTRRVKPSSGALEVVEISVKDNGNGIPEKVLDKIFQPFFTTKPTGQGTGLGLSLSYEIVTKGHGGDIKVETKDGMGSEFIVSLPVT